MIRTVFFDFYGTLVGFNPSRFVIQSTACLDFNIQLTPEGVAEGYATADAYMAEQNAVSPLRTLGPRARNKFFAEYERLVIKGAGIEITSNQAMEIWERVQQVPYRMSAYDDVLPTIKSLKSSGFTLGVISNMNRNGTTLLQDVGLTSYIDFIITSGEVLVEKPHPAIFTCALSKAGVRPHEAVHVGDQLTSDVKGALRAGITPVLLDRDGSHRCLEEFIRIEKLTDLPQVLACC